MSIFSPSCDKNFSEVVDSAWWRTNEYKNKQSLIDWCNNCHSKTKNDICKDKKFWKLKNERKDNYFNKRYPEYEDCFFDSFDDRYSSYIKNTKNDGTYNPYKLAVDKNFKKNEECLKKLKLTDYTAYNDQYTFFSNLKWLLSSNTFNENDFEEAKAEMVNTFKSSDIGLVILDEFLKLVNKYKCDMSDNLFIKLVELYGQLCIIESNKNKERNMKI